MFGLTVARVGVSACVALAACVVVLTLSGLKAEQKCSSVYETQVNSVIVD